MLFPTLLSANDLEMDNEVDNGIGNENEIDFELAFQDFPAIFQREGETEEGGGGGGGEWEEVHDQRQEPHVFTNRNRVHV